MKVLVVGSGSIGDKQFLVERYKWAELVIAVDGGASHLLSANLLPHIAIGDFDSIKPADLDGLDRKRVEIITFPEKKDYTDMELALDLAVKRGATEVLIIGATGTRLDHSIGNVLYLYNFLDKGITAWIEDEHNKIFMVKDSITLKKQENWKVSLLSLTPTVEGLTTKGLYYPLKDAVLKFGSCLGVSNEFCEDTASVTFKKGLLLVLMTKE